MNRNKPDIKRLEARFEELKKIAKIRMLTHQEGDELDKIFKDIVKYIIPPESLQG